MDDLVAEEVVSCPTVQSTSQVMSPTEVTVPLSLSQTHDLPIKRGTPVDSQAEMSHTLDHTQQVVDAMKSWESAVGVIKQVMDLVGPIVNVLYLTSFLPVFRQALTSVLQLFPHAKTAWELLSKIPKVRLITLSESIGMEHSLFFPSCR
jgi:hypothetical protein